ncbi:MAG: OmpA family protein [Myxococcales bacterium]|nr:OmpA family protein [Myxococcales bacterium]
MSAVVDRRGLWLTAFLAMGCTDAVALRGRLTATRDILRQADQNGAYVCAPRELAMGRSHVTFAERELDEGHARAAEGHFSVADVNARAALRLSPPERCAPRNVVVVEAPGDRDGDGILDPDDSCPDVPENFNGFQDTDGCPDDPDTDGDGIVDSRDMCVVDPEDRDAYQDTDGCPEADNDADGVLDAVDNCRNEPEDPDGFQDTDGCPDNDNDQDTVADLQDQCPNEAGPVDNNGCPRQFQHLQITQHGVRFRVEFDFDSARLRPSAEATLNEVVEFLNQTQHRELRYEVGGHTSSEGSRRHNERLSAARATAVRTFLMNHGIEPSRLTARGYGPSQPIEPNTTTAGREANRRVELNEIDASGRLVR